MGDRTFTAEDVIRIYQFFLSETEMETVEKFFEEAEEFVDLSSMRFVENLLDLLAGLLVTLGSPLIRALAGAFAGLTVAALNEAIRGLAETTTILGNILDEGGVDA